jgi:SAM-dependent methyltransferase
VLRRTLLGAVTLPEDSESNRPNIPTPAASTELPNPYLALSTEGDPETLRLELLAQAYDPISIARITRIGVHRGSRCIDIGIGSGSMTLVLAALVGLEGHVTATDINLATCRVSAPNVSLLRHDITRDELDPSQFDLAYSRALIGILPQRQDVLRRIIGSLALGGTVAIETFDFGPVATDGPRELVRIWDAMMRGGPLVGTEVNWLARLPSDLELAGARAVESETTVPIARGGSRAAEYWIRSLKLVGPFLEPGLIPPNSIAAAQAVLADVSRWFPLPSLTFVLGIRER